MTLEIGHKLPDFTLPANAGQTLSLADFKGKNIVLYFYPKDDTPGCTTEAKDFTRLKQEFSACNTVVIGVSKDTAAKHDKFTDKHALDLVLLCDEAGSLIEACGVWVEKNMYGRTYMGIERTTFLVGAEGLVRHIWRKVRVKGHADAVLQEARRLD